jgi:hypothetical protein
MMGSELSTIKRKAWAMYRFLFSGYDKYVVILD